MNWDMVFGLLRQLALIVVTYLVSTGALTDDQASALIKGLGDAGPVLVGLCIMGYAAWKKRDAAKPAAADKLEGVTVTVDKNFAAPAVVEAAAAKPSIKIVE